MPAVTNSNLKYNSKLSGTRTPLSQQLPFCFPWVLETLAACVCVLGHRLSRAQDSCNTHTQTQYVEYDIHTLTHSPLSPVYYIHASSTPLFHTSFQILLLSSTLSLSLCLHSCASAVRLSQRAQNQRCHSTRDSCCHTHIQTPHSMAVKNTYTNTNLIFTQTLL